MYLSYFLIRQSHLRKLTKLLLALDELLLLFIIIIYSCPISAPPSFVFGDGSQFVARAGHKIMDSSDPQTSSFSVSMTTGMCHHV